MTTQTPFPSASGLALASEISPPVKLALLWLTTVAGAVLFVTFQLFFYVNDYVRAQGHAPALTFEHDMLWMLSAYYGSWIVTLLLALSGGSTAQRCAFVLGSLLVILNTLGGIADGVRDGWYVAFSAVFFITLPGVCAMFATWQCLKKKGSQHVD